MRLVGQGDLFESRPDRIVLVDGHHLAYRNYFALGELSTSKGEPVQAIYGFLRTLLKLFREDGDCVIVVFDAPGPSFRHEAYEAYKAQRAPTPEDFKTQLERIKQIVDLLGLVRLEVPGFEADDVIGSLAKKAEQAGYEVRIVSTDRDLYQLVSDRVSVWLPDGTLVTPQVVKEKYGVSPDQWVDFRALVGDPSDNIPGVRGIGPKTAAKLLDRWSSLDRLLEHLDEVRPPGVREKIQKDLEALKLSRALSKIEASMPLEIDLASCHRREPDRDALRRYLQDLEFGSILRELGLLEARSALEASWPPPKDAFLGFVFSEARPMWASMVALAAAWEDRVAEGPNGPSALEGFNVVRGLLAKDLAVYAKREGLTIEPGDDPMLLAYLHDPANSEPAATVRRYGVGDFGDDARGRALAALGLWQAMQARMADAPELLWLYENLERPLSGVLANMEYRGIKIDVPYLRALSEELTRELERIEDEIFRLVGHPFNLNSRDQLEVVLYDELGLPVIKKTAKTGKRSTSASVLEALRQAHPVVDLVLAYRELAKLKGTYVDPLPRLVHPQTGRVHTRFHQTGTATGRLSSSDPNLQNIPVRTEWGRRIRRAFIAEAGMRLVVADYSQIELRVLAHLSGDENLQRIFREGRDVHAATASWIFGQKDVDPQMRRIAKTVNFGVLYGMGPHSLSQTLGIAYEEALDFINKYFASFPRVRAFFDGLLSEARQKGYVATLFGRRRYVPDLDSKNRRVREATERMAINMPIQGTAADLIKLAMVKLEPKLGALGARLLLQVHDELVVEAPAEQAEAVAALVRETMEGVWPLEVPLVAEVGIGENWLFAK